MASMAARVLLVGYTVALSMIMMGRGDLVWKGIAYGHNFILREINKPWGDPSIFHRNAILPRKKDINSNR